MLRMEHLYVDDETGVPPFYQNVFSSMFRRCEENPNHVMDVLSQGSSDDAGSSDVAGHDRPNAGMALEDQGGLRPLKETVKWSKMTK